MKKPISFTELSDSLQISEHHDGFWLWDDTRGMNLAMRAKSRDAAFTDALEYYQDRLKTVEAEHAALLAKVNSFLTQFQDDGDDD